MMKTRRREGEKKARSTETECIKDLVEQAPLTVLVHLRKGCQSGGASEETLLFRLCLFKKEERKERKNE